jgi:hypothetical protein
MKWNNGIPSFFFETLLWEFSLVFLYIIWEFKSMKISWVINTDLVLNFVLQLIFDEFWNNILQVPFFLGHLNQSPFLSNHEFGIHFLDTHLKVVYFFFNLSHHQTCFFVGTCIWLCSFSWNIFCQALILTNCLVKFST